MVGKLLESNKKTLAIHEENSNWHREFRPVDHSTIYNWR